MKLFKKFAAFVLVALIALTIVGCDNNSNNAEVAITFEAAKTTLTKSGSDFSIEANAEIPEGAATAKAFFFDSLATAKPVMKSVKITIE